MAKRINIHPETGTVIETKGNRIDGAIYHNNRKKRLSKSVERSLRNKAKKREKETSGRYRYSS